MSESNQDTAAHDAQPLVGVIMGSQSDWPTLRNAAEVLAEFDVPHETSVVSAHRTPDHMARYAITTCDPSQVTRLAELIEPILLKHGGLCLISDAQVIRD